MGGQSSMNDSSLKQPIPVPSSSIKESLQSLHASPNSHLANPPGCKRRASVALVIRVRPIHGQAATFDATKYPPSATVDQRLERFFDQAWVQSGVPEILFIKRAARASDRWGGHVAFPGGAREDSDTDDCAVSIRETEEEIGLSLADESCLKIGNLPERLVSAAWGRKPLLVLCPFVFLLLRYDTPPLDPQPSEVESVHWVPMLSVLDPNSRSRQAAEISDRIVPLQRPAVQQTLQILAGSLIFGAVSLEPTETKSALYQRISTTATSSMSTQFKKPHVAKQPLLLWGLTLGILADFLHMLDPQATERLWSWPTFQHWDMRLICWLLTRSIRKARAQELQSNLGRTEQSSVLGELDASTYTTKSAPGHKLNIAGGHLLDEYFGRMKNALTLAVGVRLSLSVMVVALAMQRTFRRA